MARIGIMGTAAIASKVRRGIVASGNCVAAIASRDLSKAEAWAAEAVSSGDVPVLPTAYGSYEALLADATIDAVYLPLPCATHAFFAHNIRTSPTLEPFGCLGDLGLYCVTLGLWAYQWELPATVRAVAHSRNAGGVPMDVSATFAWPTGGPDGGPRTLVFDCAFTLAFSQWAELAGTRGVLRLDDFVISRTHAACEFTTTLAPGLDAGHSVVVGDAHTTRVEGCNQEAAMWRAFAATLAPAAPAARRCRFEPHAARRSLAVQACLDAAMRSMAHDGATTPVPRPAMFDALDAAIAAAAEAEGRQA